MKTKTKILTIVSLLALALPPMASAAPPGDLSRTFDVFVAPNFNFKDGAGIHDPADENNPCTFLLLGVQNPVSTGFYYDTMRVATNFNEGIVSVSDLGGALNQALVPCPLPTSPPSNLETQWDGLNVMAYDAMSTSILLCTDMALAIGCAPSPDTVAVNATACAWSDAIFTNFGDDKGSFVGLLGSRTIDCAGGWGHGGNSHDYSDLITSFSVGRAGTTFDLIKNEDLVHNGDGTGYAVVCWDVEYTVLDSGVRQKASVHDWKLILDMGDPSGWSDALVNHVGGTSLNFQGVYDLGGDNGNPCPTTLEDIPDKKPTPII